MCRAWPPDERHLRRPRSRPGVYCRISKDDAGDLLGVTRQEKDATALCERKGWPVVRVFTDDDVSAWSGRRRPAYEAMLQALEAGEITAVAVYDLDRLHRQPRDLERFFDVCDRAGVKDLASVAGDVDLGTSDGRLLARIMGAVAAKSSDDTSRRIKRKLDDVAAEGRKHGGPVALRLHRGRNDHRAGRGPASQEARRRPSSPERHSTGSPAAGTLPA